MGVEESNSVLLIKIPTSDGALPRPLPLGREGRKLKWPLPQGREGRKNNGMVGLEAPTYAEENLEFRGSREKCRILESEVIGTCGGKDEG